MVIVIQIVFVVLIIPPSFQIIPFTSLRFPSLGQTELSALSSIYGLLSAVHNARLRSPLPVCQQIAHPVN